MAIFFTFEDFRRMYIASQTGKALKTASRFYFYNNTAHVTYKGVTFLLVTAASKLYVYVGKLEISFLLSLSLLEGERCHVLTILYQGNVAQNVKCRMSPSKLL